MQRLVKEAKTGKAKLVLPDTREWRKFAREEQLPPEGEWRTMLLRGGRGCIAPWTRIFNPITGTDERVDVLAERGEPIAVLALDEIGKSVAALASCPFIKGRERLLTFSLASGRQITVAAAHRFLTQQGWVEAKDLGVGSVLAVGGSEQDVGLTTSGKGSVGASHDTVCAVAHTDDEFDFYDLTVPHYANYLADGVWNHNSGKSWAGSHILAEWVTEEGAAGEWAIVAPSYRRLRRDCLESKDSGFIAALGGESGGWIREYNRGDGVIYLVNDAVIYTASSEDGARLIQGKNLKGVWCIARGENITTRRGPVPVEQVHTGDQVWTLSGWKKVTAARQTGWDVPVVTVTASDGSNVRCTPDHRVFSNDAWCEARDLVPGDSLITCQNSLMDLHLGENSKDDGSSSTTRWAATRIQPDLCWPRLSGAPPTDPSLMVTTSTTSTKIGLTMPSPTSNCVPVASTELNTVSRMGTSSQRSVLRPPERQPSEPGHLANLSFVSARSAENPTRHGQPPRGFAAGRTGPRASVQTSPAVVVSVSNSGLSDVFDLTVEDAHEFFAGEILVHNCEEIGLWSEYEVCWDESIRYALRKGRSQVIATGTPKFGSPSSELIIRLVSDPSVISRQLRTQDNAANLSERMLDDVMKMAGTRLGRQELEGELIEDNPDALWHLKNIDSNRVGMEDVPDLGRIVVAVDPAVTSKKRTSMLIEEVFDDTGDRRPSDETGIIVMGVGDDGHGYVLADVSGRYRPDEMARVVATAFNYWAADRVVVEVNNGGDYIPHVIATADPSIPVRSVRATRGKFTRAEPVAACYSNNIIHHVGHFPDLEQEMCFFVAGKSDQKDDRVDALVWAATELNLVSEGMSWDSVWSAPPNEEETEIVDGFKQPKNPWLKVYEQKK